VNRLTVRLNMRGRVAGSPDDENLTRVRMKCSEFTTCSPWNTYEDGYEIDVAGPTVVAEKRHPASGLVMVRTMADSDIGGKLFTLRKV